MDVEEANEKALSVLFGPSDKHTGVFDRARHSSVEFIRSQDHLSIAVPEATGKRLTAFQALNDYGWDKLLEIYKEGIAVLPHSVEEPARTIRARRESLGLTLTDISRSSGLSEDEVARCEDQRYRNPIRTLDRVAAALGLDERRLAIKPGAEGDESLATRLKRLVSPAKPAKNLPTGTASSKTPAASGATYEASKELVRRLAEAAWVIHTQARISSQLEPNLPDKIKLPRFEKNKDYGSTLIPVWKRGYDLASKTRVKLGLKPDEPVESMRALCWNKLRIPLIHCKLPTHISGATIASGTARGIVVNTNGYNQNVLMRRATIAHELGHFLWDADERLTKVHVDEFSVEEGSDHRDPVEARANAFAVAFIAPPSTVKQVFEEAGGGANGLRSVMEHFGLSFSASRHHIKNAANVDLHDSECGSVDREPSDRWKAAERLTEDLFPGENTQLSRVGEFAGLVVAAVDAGYLSVDTACGYLNMSANEFSSQRSYIRQLMPIESL